VGPKKELVGMDDRDLRRKAELAELLLHAARQLGESLEPHVVYERFHELLSDVVPHDGIVISSYDDRDDLIRCEYAWSDGNVVDPAKLPPLPLNREGGGMQSRVIVSGEPELFNDVPARVERDGVFYNVDAEGKVERIPESGPAGTNAAMMVPVKEEGRVVGVVQLMRDRGVYTDEHREVFDGLVAQMGSAVRNARLQQERRRLESAEAAARAASAEREQAAQVLEALGDGVLFVDREDIVQFWNRAATLATGLTGDSVLGKPITDVIPDWPALSRRIPVAEEGAAARSVTLPLELDGHDLWLSFVAVQIADGVVYAFRNVTSERRLEDQKNDFVATISHELRTPMTAVYGAAVTLLRRDVQLNPDQRQKLLEMIATQAARLSQITEEVLLTSQLDRGELLVGREPVHVADVVERTVETMRAQLPESTTIEVEISAEVGEASGDGDRLQQVLVNLLDNAVKYGGDRVEVRADRTNGNIRIFVADTGPGISLADRERVFDKFYRADPQLSKAPSGTGLGLYISRELTERMGGRLDLSSGKGGGATFVVELPKA
jgi:PAS domain S-box-containing protein